MFKIVSTNPNIEKIYLWQFATSKQKNNESTTTCIINCFGSFLLGNSFGISSGSFSFINLVLAKVTNHTQPLPIITPKKAIQESAEVEFTRI